MGVSRRNGNEAAKVALSLMAALMACASQDPADAVSDRSRAPHADGPEKTRDDADPAGSSENENRDDKEPKVEIVVTPRKDGTAPLTVRFKATTANIEGKLKYSWVFGDGGESDREEPGQRLYGVGRFNVILTVTDEGGKRYKASVTIESRCKG